MPGITAAIELHKAHQPRMDANDNLPIKTLSDSIRAIFGGDYAKGAAESMVNGVNNFNSSQFRKIVSETLGVDLFAAEPWLAGSLDVAIENQVALIESIPEKLLPEVQNMVTAAYNGSIRIEDLADQIFGRFSVAESRAQLIARDQTSKLNGSLTKLRQQNIGAEEYIWRGALDERERATHVAHEGIKYRWDKPPADTGNPGEDFQCRCYAEMVIPAKYLANSTPVASAGDDE